MSATWMLRKIPCCFHFYVRLILVVLISYATLFSYWFLKTLYYDEISGDTELADDPKSTIREIYKCQLPDLTAWSYGSSTNNQLSCIDDDSRNKSSVEYHVSIDRGRLSITRVHKAEVKGRVCSLFPIIRLDDYISVYGESIDNVTDGFRPSWPQFMVLCQSPENLNAFAGVPWNDSSFGMQERHFICGSFPPVALPIANIELVARSPTYNILLLGLDSISRMAAVRYLPKTMQLVNDLPNAITMQLYNVIGDGTTANLLALLTGLSEKELPEARTSHVSVNHNVSVLDKYPWIWEDFAKIGGYATHFIEDTPKWGTFQHRLTGFGANRAPTHSYGRPCLQAAAHDEEYYGKKLGCTTSRFTHHVLLESLREFFHAYSHAPRFSLTFLSELIHEDPAYAVLLDADLERLLREILNDDKLGEEENPGDEFGSSSTQSQQRTFANTLVFLFADHGPRMGKARLSVQGKLEERLPLLSIILPKKFQRSWPQATRHLRTNVNRLVTLFDVHATLVHLLIKQYGSSQAHLNTRRPIPVHGRSLFKPISSNRTCAQAGIAPHWCTCLHWQDMNRPDRRSVRLPWSRKWPTIVYLASNAVTTYVNQQVKHMRYRKITDVTGCSDLRLGEILSSEQADLPQELLHFVHSKDVDGRIPEYDERNAELNSVGSTILRLHLLLNPGKAHFEATVSLGEAFMQDQSAIRILDINRLDVYEQQAKCLRSKQWPEFRRFCVCT
ncbi:hypothetical protein PHET_06411 [Paragonimus heterotremus]|uniref:Uncharacterized protein n=1 Tax=Paragonimus heterotremus TaxID=100268 RepID=A0A8J4SN50_9TREM|nr:hypothetical protein PHET_06411 [Paragonimus heterotremus]